MIFPTESVLELRASLQDRIDDGDLAEAEAYREGLAADPEDPRALRLLALLAEEQGDYEAASDLGWRFLRADPLFYEAYHLIGRLLSRNPEDAARGRAYLALGDAKLHINPDAEGGEAPAAPGPDPNEPPEVA